MEHGAPKNAKRIRRGRLGYTCRMELNQPEILAELKEMNRALERQNSLLHMLAVGIIYGIGFFIGSAILATIIFGILGPLFAGVPWVRSAYEQGNSLIGR